MITIFIDDRALNLLKIDMQALARDLAGTNRMRQPLLRIAKEVLGPSINRNFAAGGRPERWEPSVPISTYRQKKRGGDEPTLWVTGKMKKAASAMKRFRVKQNTMTYGYFPPTVWFAMVHDNATIARRANIPQRPFALIQSEDVEDIIRIFMEWIESRVNRYIKRFYF